MQEENEMMAAEPTMAAEPASLDGGDEETNDEEPKPAEEPTEKMANEGASASDGSFVERLDKTKELVKDFGKTVTIDKPKQMFADIQGMASNLKDKVASIANQGDGPTVAGESEDRQDSERTKSDALELSKQFLSDMKEKASAFKIKMPTAGEERLDENGKPIPGALDRSMKAVTGFASGLRRKRTNIQASRNSADDGGAIYTVSEEDGEGATTATDSSSSSSRRHQIPEITTEISVKFNQFVNSAKTTASEIGMPSLRSIGLGVGGVDPISAEEGGARDDSLAAMEEIEFYRSGGDTSEPGPEGTALTEVVPTLEKQPSNQQPITLG